MIDWLSKWYKSQCNGTWEHLYGVKIETLDNPGWFVQIDLSETDVAGKSFETFKRDKSDDDWIMCRVNDGMFEGLGDCSKLTEIIEVFQKFTLS